MPEISALGLLLGLDPEKNKSELQAKSEELMQNCEKTRNAIFEEAKRGTIEMKEIVAKRIAKMENALKAMPAPSPQAMAIEKKAKEASQAAIGQASAMTPQESLNFTTSEVSAFQ